MVLECSYKIRPYSNVFGGGHQYYQWAFNTTANKTSTFYNGGVLAYEVNFPWRW